MIDIKCTDQFLHKEICNLLYQKNIALSDQSSDFFSQIDILNNEKNIIVKLNEDSLIINKPFIFNSFFKKLYLIISNINYLFQGCQYFPYKNTMVFKNKSSILSDKHNLIFSNLFFNYNEGINKTNLYKIVWPKDKITHINKLDTHLTNLKSQISKDLNLLIEFNSSKGLIKLRIN